MATKERLYRVCFDTQRDRQYITWGLFLLAHNQSEAKDIAYELWNSDANPRYKLRKFNDDYPHMFHVDASRMEDKDHEIGEFFVIDSKHANWGYKKTYFGYW